MAYSGMKFFNAAAPPNVQRASILLYIGLALSLASDFIGHANDGDSLSWGMFVLLAGYAVLLWICACVANGSNWARIAVTLLWLLVAVATVAVVATLGLAGPPWEVTTLLDILTFGIDAYALFLIWTKPGSAGFRRVDRTAAGAAAASE
jgi:hypothetical protein